MPSPTISPRFFRRLAQHARAQVLLRILEIELLGDGDPVIADERWSPLALEQDRLRPRAQGDANRIRQLRRTVKDLFPRPGMEQNLFVSHLPTSPLRNWPLPRPSAGDHDQGQHRIGGARKIHIEPDQAPPSGPAADSRTAGPFTACALKTTKAARSGGLCRFCLVAGAGFEPATFRL